MFTKTLFVSVAFGAVGLAGICYFWRKSKIQSTLEKEIGDLKVRKVYAGGFGYIRKHDNSTSLESVLEYIKAKKNISQSLRENANLIPTLAVEKYLAMNPGNVSQDDVLEEEIDNLLDKEPRGKSNTVQNTLRPFSAVKDEKENFKNKPRDYAIIDTIIQNYFDKLKVNLEF